MAAIAASLLPMGLPHTHRQLASIRRARLATTQAGGIRLLKDEQSILFMVQKRRQKVCNCCLYESSNDENNSSLEAKNFVFSGKRRSGPRVTKTQRRIQRAETRAKQKVAVDRRYAVLMKMVDPASSNDDGDDAAAAAAEYADSSSEESLQQQFQEGEKGWEQGNGNSNGNGLSRIDLLNLDAASAPYDPERMESLFLSEEGDVNGSMDIFSDMWSGSDDDEFDDEEDEDDDEDEPITRGEGDDEQAEGGYCDESQDLLKKNRNSRTGSRQREKVWKQVNGNGLSRIDLLNLDAASAPYDPERMGSLFLSEEGDVNGSMDIFSDILSGSDDDEFRDEEDVDDEDELIAGEGDDEQAEGGCCDESQDLLKKFLNSRTGNRNTSEEGRVYKFNKKASGRLSIAEKQVLSNTAVHSIDWEPGLQISKPWIVRGNEFLYPASRVKEGSRMVSRNLENGSSNVTGYNEDANFTSTMREVLQIAYNLPTNHVLEDYLGPFMNKVNGIEANLILEALAEEDVTQQVLSFFRWMQLHEPCLWDPRSFSLLFVFLGKVGMPDEALTYFQMLPSEKRFHSVEVYNTLITGLTNCDRHSEIFSLLEQMQSWGTKPDSVTFSILMTAARKGGNSFKEVWAVYEGMIERGVSPDVTVFGSLIKALCDVGNLKEALVVTNEMERLRVPLNTVIYNILIDAYGKAGQLEEAEGLLSEMREKGIEPNVETYNALINGYGSSKMFKVAEALIQEMETTNLQPDVVTFTLLISAYGHAQMSEQAAQVFQRIQARGIAPNSRSYTALIHAYAEGRWHQKAAKAFEMMQKEGLIPTVETYTALIDAYRRAGDLEMVKEVWKAMKAAGCVGTRITYVTIVDAFAKKGQLKETRDLIEEFKNLGHHPDLLVYNMLLNAYARGGRHQKTPEILKEIKAAGFEPDSYTYCTLIYAFLRVRDFTKAFKYHTEMLRKKKAPDAKTYAKLRAILKVVEKRVEDNNRKAKLGQWTSGKKTEKAKAFWKGRKRPSRRLIK